MKGDAVKEPIQVTVRYRDGYREEYEADEVRFGADLLWIRLADGKNRHIPTREVRWWSIYPEDHEKAPETP